MNARNIFFLVFAVVLFVFTVGISVLATIDRDPIAILFWLGAPLTAGVVGFVYLARLGIRRRSTTDVVHRSSEAGQRQVVIRYSRPVWVTYWSMGFVTLLEMAFLAIVSGLALTAVESLSVDSIVGILGFSALAVAAGYLTLFCLQGLTGKLARGYVAMSPHGVAHRGWGFRSYAPWDGIIDVHAVEQDGPLIDLVVASNGGAWFARTSRLWKQEELAFAPSLAIRGRWLSVDPALLFHALRYYHANPGARAELASAAAVRRLREARLP